MKITLTEAVRLAQQAFEAVGIPREQAEISATALARAEADGIASHGLSRVPQYSGHVLAGRVNSSAVPVESIQRIFQGGAA